ncbi:MAG: DHA2 family efflux MFS transporter permease subunit [Gammaproteobacteria bacterium]|nr:DHA2 family efflux MFS transporter permease subunit [Gammaproteobacteria bacterium]
MVVFPGGSVLGGMAGGGDLLIVSRFIQGAGAGLMTPVSMLIIFQVFPVHRRGWAMGIYSVGVVLAPALGPVIGGYLIDHLSWRYVFFIAVPFALISIPMSMVFMPAREPDARSPRFDWYGVGLLSVFLLALLTALSNGSRDGWGDDGIAILFFVAGCTGVAFFWWEARTDDPMFDLSLFANGRFLAAAIVTFIIGAGLYGSTYLLPLFLQVVQGLKPTDSGLLMLPAGLTMAVFFPLAGRLSDTMSPRRLILFGTAVFAFSSLLLAGVDTDTPFATLALWALIGRFGLSFIFPCLNAAALQPLSLDQLAQGSGMINFLRQLGGAFGVNLLAILLERRSVFHAESFTLTQTPDNAETRGVIEQLTPLLLERRSRPGLGRAVRHGDLGRMLWLQGHMLGYRDAFLVVALVFFLSRSRLCSWRAARPRPRLRDPHRLRTTALQRRHAEVRTAPPARPGGPPAPDPVRGATGPAEHARGAGDCRAGAGTPPARDHLRMRMIEGTGHAGGEHHPAGPDMPHQCPARRGPGAMVRCQHQIDPPQVRRQPTFHVAVDVARQKHRRTIIAHPQHAGAAVAGIAAPGGGCSTSNRTPSQRQSSAVSQGPVRPGTPTGARTSSTSIAASRPGTPPA